MVSPGIRLGQVEPRERAGAQTGRKYEYQYERTARAALDLLTDTARHVCVYCDWHDDYVIETGDPPTRYMFHQVKGRTSSQGPWDFREFFGVSHKEGKPSKKAATVNLKAIVPRMLLHYANFGDNCAGLAFVTNAGLDPALSEFLESVARSADVEALPPDARIAADYRVFVHFLDSEGQQMWTDDHDPAIPTSQWKPGQKVQYTRTVFMPIFPYQGPATVTIGLYNGPRLEDRLPLNGDGKGREYTVGTVELLPQSENIYVAMREGWHSLEMAPEDPAREWQWMKKTGTLAFRNPKQNVTLYLETDGRPDLFPNAPQVISVIVNGTVAHQFRVDQKDPVLRRLPLTAAQLGNGDTVEIRLEADKAFVPAQVPGVGGDPRELSIRVYHAFVEPAR